MLTSDHTLIKHRRNWSSIYHCPQHTHYLKVGTSHQIQTEVLLYQSAKSLWFQLPDLLWYDILADDISWMKESVMGWWLYSDIFTQDCHDMGYIWDEHFADFCAYQSHHLACQLSSVWSISLWSFVSKRDMLRSEWKIDSSLIETIYSMIAWVLQPLPIARNHGDHNPYNIFESWFIDLEDSFMGPIWYDTVTSLTQNFRFPISGAELCQQHRFTPIQIQQYYIQLLSSHDCDSDQIFWALMIMRWIFVTVWSWAFPLLEQYRYSKLKHTIEHYIDWWNMHTYFIKNYRTI